MPVWITGVKLNQWRPFYRGFLQCQTSGPPLLKSYPQPPLVFSLTCSLKVQKSLFFFLKYFVIIVFRFKMFGDVFLHFVVIILSNKYQLICYLITFWITFLKVFRTLKLNPQLHKLSYLTVFIHNRLFSVPWFIISI